MILKDRIIAVRTHSGLNVSQFSHKVGFKTPQTIRELESGRTKSISYEVLNKILNIYPEINRTWLETGEGEMLNSTTKFSQSNSGGNNQQIEKVGDHADLRTGTFYEPCPDDAQHIKDLEKEVENLKGKLVHKDDLIKQMKKTESSQDDLIKRMKKTESSQENLINQLNAQISELKERINEMKSTK